MPKGSKQAKYQRISTILSSAIIEHAVHKFYFLPKFHSEINPIEMYCWVKNRESFCLNIILFSNCFKEFTCLEDETFLTAKKLISGLLDVCKN